MTENCKKIAEMWKTLTDEQKEPYNVKARADQARYKADMENSQVAVS